jgi:hypothetical protein
MRYILAEATHGPIRQKEGIPGHPDLAVLSHLYCSLKLDLLSKGAPGHTLRLLWRHAPLAATVGRSASFLANFLLRLRQPLTDRRVLLFDFDGPASLEARGPHEKLFAR